MAEVKDVKQYRAHCPGLVLLVKAVPSHGNHTLLYLRVDNNPQKFVELPNGEWVKLSLVSGDIIVELQVSPDGNNKAAIQKAQREAFSPRRKKTR